MNNWVYLAFGAFIVGLVFCILVSMVADWRRRSEALREMMQMYRPSQEIEVIKKVGHKIVELDEYQAKKDCKKA